MLTERKRIKEEEAAAKEARKLMREEQKVKRQQEKEQKQKEREDKKRLRELEKQRKAKEAEARRIEKEQCRKRKHGDESENESDGENSVYDDDELDDVDVHITSNCYACGESYDNNEENWVSCHKCPRWLHRGCVSTIDLLSLSEDDIADIEFECDYC